MIRCTKAIPRTFPFHFCLRRVLLPSYAFPLPFTPHHPTPHHRPHPSIRPCGGTFGWVGYMHAHLDGGEQQLKAKPKLKPNSSLQVAVSPCIGHSIIALLLNGIPDPTPKQGPVLPRTGPGLRPGPRDTGHVEKNN